MNDRSSGPRAVDVQALTVRYGELVALDAVSLSADFGEVVAVLGPNGAGKTSLVETLEGYRRPASGHVTVAGLDPSGEHDSLVGQIGVVLQRGGVYPTMSADRALRLFASYYDDPRDPGELLELLSLSGVARTPYKRLSGGEQQRLALALALVGRPRVAFLDEPTAGVDPVGRLAVRDMVARLRDDGVCVVLASHELDEVERVADRVVVLHHGTVVAAGRPDELAGGVGEIRFSMEPGIEVSGLASVLGAPVAEVGPGEYVAALPPAPAAVAALTGWLAERDLVLGSLSVGKERLEDVFLRLVAEEPPGQPATGAGGGGRPSRRRARRSTGRAL